MMERPELINAGVEESKKTKLLRGAVVVALSASVAGGIIGLEKVSEGNESGTGLQPPSYVRSPVEKEGWEKALDIIGSILRY